MYEFINNFTDIFHVRLKDFICKLNLTHGIYHSINISTG